MTAARTLLICSLVMLALTAVKLVVAVMTGSIAVLAEAIHSGIDACIILLGLTFVSQAGRGNDHRYTYGRGRFENVSALVEGSFVFFAGIVLGYEALTHESGEPPAWYAAATVLFSGLVTALLVKFIARRARALQSPALWADSIHLSGDVWAALAVGLGLLVAPVLPSSWPVDIILASAVAAIIIFSGLILVRGSIMILADKALDASELEPLLIVMNEPAPGITGYHRFRTRASGPLKYIDFHLTVQEHLTIGEVHQICDELENRLLATMPNLDVTIHVEPEGWEE